MNKLPLRLEERIENLSISNTFDLFNSLYRPKKALAQLNIFFISCAFNDKEPVPPRKSALSAPRKGSTFRKALHWHQKNSGNLKIYRHVRIKIGNIQWRRESFSSRDITCNPQALRHSSLLLFGTKASDSIY